ncbi:AAA family ATPase [Candidatus Woesearchaeota archaeon]|nr:AAA family ATPase [Candidatus Woesearchaeota archaeon]
MTIKTDSPSDAQAIIVSGTPGTGKTTIAKKLARTLNYKYLDVNEIISNMGSEYDKERDCRVVDIKELCRRIRDIITNESEKSNNSDSKGRFVVDSHLAHNLEPDLVQYVLITKCDITELNSRLKDRGYSEKKIRENLDSEIFDICREEAIQKGHKVLTVDTTPYKPTKAMVFGTFDHLHKGHIYLFKKASQGADQLIVIVARDTNVEKIKGKLPDNSEIVRLRNIRKAGIAHIVMLGDKKDKLAPIIRINPDTIYLGYDQTIKIKELRALLAKHGLAPEILRIRPYKEKIFKSSIIKKNSTVLKKNRNVQ